MRRRPCSPASLFRQMMPYRVAATASRRRRRRRPSAAHLIGLERPRIQVAFNSRRHDLAVVGAKSALSGGRQREKKRHTERRSVAACADITSESSHGVNDLCFVRPLGARSFVSAATFDRRFERAATMPTFDRIKAGRLWRPGRGDVRLESAN